MTAKVLPFSRPPNTGDPDCPICTGGRATGQVCPRCVANAPMRKMVDRLCKDCGQRWTQPSDEGACPRCHGEDILNLDESINHLVRR